MSNIKVNGKIEGQNLELANEFSALKNIGGGFTISDPVNVGIELGRRDGVAGTPYIDFHTDGTTSDYNVRLIAQNNALHLGQKGASTSEIATKQTLKQFFGKNKPSSTTLFDGEVNSGDISLSQSWQNFDMLAIYISLDNGSCLGIDFVPTWKIKEAIAFQNSKGREGVAFAALEPSHWYVKKSSTGHVLYVQAENSRIYRILGINWE